MIHNGCAIFLWPASFVLPNALRAANDVRFTMVVATASMLVWRMGLSWILCVNMGMGAVGVWIAMIVDWVCRILCFVARFASGAWQKKCGKEGVIVEKENPYEIHQLECQRPACLPEKGL